MAISLVGSTVQNNNSTASTLAPITVPAGSAVDDYEVVALDHNTTTAPTGPAGWTLALAATGTAVSGAVYYRKVTGVEPASYDFTVASKWSGTMHLLRGVDLTTPLDVAVPARTTGTTAMSFPAITPVTVGAWIMAFAFYGETLGAPTTPTSSNLDAAAIAWAHTTAASGTFNAHTAVGHKVWASGAFTPAMTVGTITQNRGVTVAFRPAAVAAAPGRVRRMSRWR